MSGPLCDPAVYCKVVVRRHILNRL